MTTLPMSSFWPLKAHLILPRQSKYARLRVTQNTKKPSAFTEGFDIKVVPKGRFELPTKGL